MVCVSRVPFRSVVVGLLSHQILVQTLGCLLLQGTSNMVKGESSLMAASSAGDTGKDGQGGESLIHDTPLPGQESL